MCAFIMVVESMVLVFCVGQVIFCSGCESWSVSLVMIVGGRIQLGEDDKYVATIHAALRWLASWGLVVVWSGVGPKDGGFGSWVERLDDCLLLRNKETV